MVDLSIVVVGTNEKDFIYNCLNSIAHSNTRYKVETICIDNGSTDGTMELCGELFKEVTFISNPHPTGYIECNNRGIRMAKGRYIMLLNADIELNPDTIEGMVSFMDNHPDGAAGTCRLNFDDGSLQLNCRRFPTPMTYLARLPHFFRWLKFGKKWASNRIVSDYLMLDYDHKQPIVVDWVVSALFLLRKSAVDDIGLLDEDLVPPFYLEDVDWCFRAYLRKWKIYYIPTVSAMHYYKRGSVKKFTKLSLVHILNVLIFFRKHGLKMLLNKSRK